MEIHTDEFTEAAIINRLTDPGNDLRPIKEAVSLPKIHEPWLAASALQKAIRRGNQDTAIRAACLLSGTQSERLWRRLKVIALEDIGITDPRTVADVLWVAGKKVWRQQRCGDFQIASRLISRLCKAIKSQEACDLLVIADWHPQFEWERRAYAEMSKEELARIVRFENEPLAGRVIAAWYLAGTRRLRSATLLCRDGHFSNLADVYTELGLPAPITQIAKWGATRMNEAHPISLPLVWLTATASTSSEVRDETQFSLGEVGGWPSEAFDMHTRLGKAAFAKALNDNRSLRDLIEAFAPQANPIDALGNLIFRIEGTCVDRRLVHSWTDEIIQTAAFAQNNWAETTQDRGRDVMRIVRTHLPEIHEARKAVVRDSG